MTRPFTTVPGHISSAWLLHSGLPTAPKEISIGSAIGKAEALRATGAAYTYAL